MKESIAANCPLLDLNKWKSSPLASIAWKTPANFLQARDLTSKLSPRKLTVNS